jgi:hypothetical protein
VEAAADAAEEVAAEVEEAADQVMEDAEEVMEDAEAAVEEMTEEEPTAVPVEEPMDEGPCAPATDGPLAGVDPRGVTFTWWYNHSGSREEQLLPLLDEFNATNECGITVEGLNQGGYNDIRDAVNSSVAAGEIPATLVVGYQNDQAFYQLNDTLADLNVYLNDPTWGLR